MGKSAHPLKSRSVRILFYYQAKCPTLINFTITFSCCQQFFYVFAALLGLSYICEYLGITMSEFFDFSSANPLKLSRINEYLKKLNDEQLEIVENLVKNLADK